MITITDHGARPGADHVQTREIQQAIEQAAAQGGGTVVIPCGCYQTGTLSLRSHVTLHLENGACLRGSPRIEDYPDLAGFTDAVGQKRGRCLIHAQGIEHAAITGKGVIDGNGNAFGWEEDGRPFLVRFIDCRDVEVSGVTLRDSPGWVSHYLNCERLSIHNLTIRSYTNANNDGIDIDSCRNVRISHCDIGTGDDAICIKATRSDPTENVVVTGCVIQSDWGAIKLGTESVGDFRNILVSDCVIRDTLGGGLKLISMDGCRMENVQVSNLIMDNVSGPIFLRLGSRLRTYYQDQARRETGIMRNIRIRNIQMRVWERGEPLWGFARRAGIFIGGVPGYPIEDVRFENIDAIFPGGGTAEEAARRDVPERIADYPEFPAFGPLPSWGFYLRHVRNITLDGIRMRTELPDARAPLYADDAQLLKLGAIEIDGSVIEPGHIVYQT